MNLTFHLIRMDDPKITMNCCKIVHDYLVQARNNQNNHRILKLKKYEFLEDQIEQPTADQEQKDNELK